MVSIEYFPYQIQSNANMTNIGFKKSSISTYRELDILLSNIHFILILLILFSTVTVSWNGLYSFCIDFLFIKEPSSTFKVWVFLFPKSCKIWQIFFKIMSLSMNLLIHSYPWHSFTCLLNFHIFFSF